MAAATTPWASGILSSVTCFKDHDAWFIAGECKPVFEKSLRDEHDEHSVSKQSKTFANKLLFLFPIYL